MKKRFFNMIEVVLALSVSAIGITAIMGIIPLGLKANRDAQAETFVSDIAKSYFAKLSLDAAGTADFDQFYTTKIKSIPKVAKSSVTVDGNTIGTYKNPTTPDPDDWKEKEDGVIKFAHKFTDDGVDFDISKLTTKNYIRAFVGKKDGDNEVLPDFTADICIWKCLPDDIPDVDNEDEDGKRHLIRVYLEVSWPINASYDKREKRIFVREFFDTKKRTELE